MCLVPSVHLVFILKWNMNNDVVSSHIEHVNMFIFESTRIMVCLVWFCETTTALHTCVCVEGTACSRTPFVHIYVSRTRQRTKSDDWDWNVPRICDYIESDIQCLVFGWFGCARCSNDANTQCNLGPVVRSRELLTDWRILVCLRFKNRQHFTPCCCMCVRYARRFIIGCLPFAHFLILSVN